MENKRSFDQLLNGEKPVLVDFFAEWCGPCRMMSPVLRQLKQQMGDRLIIIKVDVDRNAPLAQHYSIQGIPALILFANGKIKWRHSGVIPARQLEAVLREHI